MDVSHTLEMTICVVNQLKNDSYCQGLYETEIVLNSSLMIPDFPHIIKKIVGLILFLYYEESLVSFGFRVSDLMYSIDHQKCQIWLLLKQHFLNKGEAIFDTPFMIHTLSFCKYFGLQCIFCHLLLSMQYSFASHTSISAFYLIKKSTLSGDSL